MHKDSKYHTAEDNLQAMVQSFSSIVSCDSAISCLPRGIIEQLIRKAKLSTLDDPKIITHSIGKRISDQACVVLFYPGNIIT